MSNIAPDHRVYADLNQLVRMQFYAKRSVIHQRQVVRSILYGRNKSRLRGRGLSFEELRAYRIGDDIRTLDWKTTNRTGKPHVRVFSEERERDVLLLVDQRKNMFFGSQVQTKSVTAADVAALLAWSALSLQDRVGALVFNDDSITKIKPQRSHKAVMQILQSIVQMNHQLKVVPETGNQEQLNGVLEQAERLCRHDSTVFLVSDLDGMNHHSMGHFKRLKEHNNLVLSLVADPLEQCLPQHHQLAFSDGYLQISLDTRKQDLVKKHDVAFSDRLALLRHELSDYEVPIWPIETVTLAYEQLFGIDASRSVPGDESQRSQK